MEDLSFENSSSGTWNESNIGGPPIYDPSFSSIATHLSTAPNHHLSSHQKRCAYQSYVDNSGYMLFDLTQITNAAASSQSVIVNATAFYTFFTLFLILLIVLIALMCYNYISVMFGLYILTILSFILYVASVLYRQQTLTSINSATDLVNANIAANKVQFDHSVIQLPNSVVNMSSMLNSMTDPFSSRSNDFPSSF